MILRVLRGRPVNQRRFGTAPWMLGQTSERHRLALRSIFRCYRGFLPAGQEQAFIEPISENLLTRSCLSFFFLLILIGFPLSAFVLLCPA